MKKLVPAVCCSVALMLFAMSAFAQNPISAGQKAQYTSVKNNILRSAEKMPEADYAFKPTPEVRNFGQLLAHVADANYMICSIASGKTNPAPGVEKTKTTKADIVQALKESFAYCDPVYDGMTDAQGVEIVKMFGSQVAKLTALSANTGHDMEHYGNIVTYLRMKGIVPPSSERR